MKVPRTINELTVKNKKQILINAFQQSYSGHYNKYQKEDMNKMDRQKNWHNQNNEYENNYF